MEGAVHERHADPEADPEQVHPLVGADQAHHMNPPRRHAGLQQGQGASGGERRTSVAPTSAGVRFPRVESRHSWLWARSNPREACTSAANEPKRCARKNRWSAGLVKRSTWPFRQGSAKAMKIGSIPHVSSKRKTCDSR